MTSTPNLRHYIRNAKYGNLVLFVLIGVTACDTSPTTTEPAMPSARSAGYDSPSDSNLDLSPACPIPDGPWRRGAVLGPDELREFMLAFEPGCPQARIATPSRETLAFIALEPEDTSSPDTFCTQDWPAHLVSRDALPARAEEAAVVPPRFASQFDPIERLVTFPKADLVEPTDMLRLVGLDGSWQADSEAEPTP